MLDYDFSKDGCCKTKKNEPDFAGYFLVIADKAKKNFSSSQGEFTTPLPGLLNKPLHMDKPVS
jgi:hypothetical protein